MRYQNDGWMSKNRFMLESKKYSQILPIKDLVEEPQEHNTRFLARKIELRFDLWWTCNTIKMYFGNVSCKEMADL